MKLDPEIAALRRDPAPQVRAQRAMLEAARAWANEPDVAPVLGELEALGAGAALEACPTLERLFAGQDADAGECAASLVHHLCAAMRAEPLGQPPMRHGFTGEVSSLLLARCGRAQLLLQAREPRPHSSFPTVSFSDALRYEAVLAGEARATIVCRRERVGTDATLDEACVAIGPGMRLALDCRYEALLVEEVTTRLVSLRLQRLAANPAPTSEHERAGGRFLGQSCADLAVSRREMMVTLLGRMERAEAAPVLAEMAREAGDQSLRWQALRECLALDTAQGFRALGSLASQLEDPLCADAAALRAQLVETYPQLLDLERRPCPA